MILLEVVLNLNLNLILRKKSSKNSESKGNNDDEEDDSSYRAPDGQDIVKLNKVNAD